MVQQQTGSATIHQFPVGGRDGQRQRDAMRDSLAALPRVTAAVGESWYHAEAIQDAQQAKPQ